MKNGLYVISILFCLIFSPVARSQCYHRHAFGKSPVADTIDVLHYKIHLQAIDFQSKTISALASLTLIPRIPVTSIPLELKALQVSEAWINGVNASFSQNNDILRIHSNQQYQPEDTLEVNISYGGVPFHENWGGFHFSGNYAFNLGVGFESDPHNLGKAWFPCVDDFQDRATYEVFITLPAEMKGIAGGLLTDTIHHADERITWHWTLNQAIPTYLASVAAGNYSLTASVYNRGSDSLPVTIYTRPADTLKVAGSFQHLEEIIALFENRFGPYPFDRIGYTGTAIGAMEHVTNIAYPHSAINGNLNSEYLLSHELSHMWFGNLVTCADAGDMWLNEGWATFCHYFYKHDLYGEDIYRTEMNANHLDILKNAHLTDGSYLALHDVPTEYTYGTTVYDKGATVVHTLMNYLGKDVFFEAIRNYLQQFAFSHASSYDIRDFLSSETGVDLTGFFNNWVFTAGTPHYSIDSMRVIPEGSTYKTHLYLKQKHKGINHTGSGHVFEVTLKGTQGQLFTDTVHLDAAVGHSVKTLNFQPVLALTDLYDKTADATTDLDGWLTTTGEKTFPGIYFKLFTDALPEPAYYRLTHHWVAPDSMKQAVDGLRLSPYRYWEMKGIFSAGTAMRGRFFYSNINSLDAGLILSENDSVMILYRQDAGHDWQMVQQVREGLWNIGYIIVDEMLPGQYTLAVLDTQFVGLQPLQANSFEPVLQLEPNPASDSVRISWNETPNCEINIIDQSGQLILTKQIWGQNSWTMPTGDLAKTWYLVQLKNLGTNQSQFKKLILK